TGHTAVRALPGPKKGNVASRPAVTAGNKGPSRAPAAAIAMTRRNQRSIDLWAAFVTAPEESGSGPGPERSSAGTECAHAGRSISWSASSMSARSGLHSACSALKTVRRARLDASGDISLSRLGFRGTADEGVLANPGAVDAGPVVHAGPR